MYENIEEFLQKKGTHIRITFNFNDGFFRLSANKRGIGKIESILTSSIEDGLATINNSLSNYLIPEDFENSWKED